MKVVRVVYVVYGMYNRGYLPLNTDRSIEILTHSYFTIY